MKEEEIIVNNEKMVTNLISLKEMKLLKSYRLNSHKEDRKQRV